MLLSPQLKLFQINVRRMKKCVRWGMRLLSVTIVLCVPVLGMAQIDPGCDPAVDPACVPIDGGLGLLIAAGVGYGIKKVRDSRKKDYKL